MEYKEIKPCIELEPFIHSFWELKGSGHDGQWERIFPDGCPGLVLNLGESCITDSGSLTMEFGKTYVAGTMTSFKDSFIDNNTNLLGVCLKPAAFANFYNYVSQHELTNNTVEFDKSCSFDLDKSIKDPFNYFNQFFTDRISNKYSPLKSILKDIQESKGRLNISGLARRNYTTVRQLERNFKKYIGIPPKEYANIVRFQNAISIIKKSGHKRSFSDIAFESGYYDHSHLADEVKRNTGLTPSQL